MILEAFKARRLGMIPDAPRARREFQFAYFFFNFGSFAKVKKGLNRGGGGGLGINISHRSDDRKKPLAENRLWVRKNCTSYRNSNKL